MGSVTVFSHRAFNEFCRSNRIDDSNVEARFSDCAFISIVCSDTAKGYFDSDIFTTHYFKDNHENVLNVNFDDCSEDILYDGQMWIAITPQQGEDIVAFIEKNEGKKIYIHCLAGKSRSQAVGKFIMDTYPFSFKEFNHIVNTPNGKVLKELNDAYMRIHKINKEEMYNDIFSK